MRFRPCIDIHNGKVKQIVGGSLQDQGDQAQENYVAEQDAPFFARLYQSRGIRGGHIILLNPATSPYYEATRQQAVEALKAYPGGMQIGGGIREDNAESFLDAGASHVIVTSYVFKNGVINWENLKKLERAVGRKHLVLDLSCRKKDGQYYIVTDRWQKFTQVPVSEQTIEEFSSHCDEFLVHAVDVEGKASGIEVELVKLLAKNHQRIKKLISADRLLQKRADACQPAMHNQLGILHGTDHNNLATGIHGMNTPAALNTISIRQIHIHSHHIRSRFCVQIYCMRSILCHRTDLKISLGQHRANHHPTNLGVIYHHYPNFLHQNHLHFSSIITYMLLSP